MQHVYLLFITLNFNKPWFDFCCLSLDISAINALFRSCPSILVSIRGPHLIHGVVPSNISLLANITEVRSQRQRGQN